MQLAQGKLHKEQVIAMQKSLELVPDGREMKKGERKRKEKTDFFFALLPYVAGCSVLLIQSHPRPAVDE